MMMNQLNIARILENSSVNGPGARAVIWFQGCNRHCKGCINESMWSFEKKQLFTPENLYNKIIHMKGIEGITLTGGEPLLQAENLIPFLIKIKEANLSVICFTGYEISEISNKTHSTLLENVDVLITGPYIEELRDQYLSLRGSSNQELIFLSSRYDIEDFKEVQEVEIILDEREIIITGFPSKKLLEGLLD
jgi:anaerobic ribonucleoside-triphosphate reductase activating protein